MAADGKWLKNDRKYIRQKMNVFKQNLCIGNTIRQH